ncbi:MAG: peptidylprolyl isomerase [Candidatus Sulfotelmatobacter sp.]
MRLQCLLCILLTSFASGQAARVAPTSAVPAPATSESPETKVGPDDPVITLNDFCTVPAQPDHACQTVITRVEFEKLTEALQPGMSLSLKLNVANTYARNLKMSAAAEKRGLDKTPEFEEEMRYARMQLLGQDLSRALQTEANRITDADLEDYYAKNRSSFEQATLARIFVPRTKQTAPAERQEAQNKSGEDARAKVAADLRARAANGEDLDQLQIEAYKDAGFGQTTVNTKLENVRRATLPPQHESVMGLRPGEVSQVFSDPSGAHFIYKMIARQTLTLEDAKAEIRTTISTQRYRDSMKEFQGNVVFSDAYFNPPATSATPPQRNRKRKRKKLPAEPDAPHD